MSNKKNNHSPTPGDPFFTRFWSELYNVNNELFQENADPIKVFLHLQGLCNILPPAVKKQLRVDFDKMLTSIRKSGFLVYLVTTEQEKLTLTQEMYEPLISVSNMIDKVSTVVHEWQARKKKSSK